MIQNISSQLKLNDTCPDLRFTDVLNISRPIISFSDFNDKALIIDFWNTQCKSCLENLSKLDSLQQQFKDDLQILLVTKQSKKEIQDFFARFKKIKIPNIPLIVSDTILHSLFPSEGYPYVVWLDRSRVVKYLTGSYNVTSQHIDQFLKGDTVWMKHASVKTSYAPLWTLNDSSFRSNVKYYSCITACINGLDIHEPEGALINGNGAVQLSYNCMTVLDLFKIAFGEGGKYPVNTKYAIKLEIDSAIFTKPGDANQWDKWEKDHLFNYQLVLAASKREALYKTMQEDLIRYFDFSAFSEKQKVKGYALTIANGKKLMASKASKSFDIYNDGNVSIVDTLRFLKQQPQRLASLINSWLYYRAPFQNKITDSTLIDFNIRKASLNPNNIAELRKDLKRCNLDLQETFIEIDVLIIKTKNKAAPVKQP